MSSKKTYKIMQLFDDFKKKMSADSLISKQVEGILFDDFEMPQYHSIGAWMNIIVILKPMEVMDERFRMSIESLNSFVDEIRRKMVVSKMEIEGSTMLVMSIRAGKPRLALETSVYDKEFSKECC